jgi:S1-C subfamily serine protease
MDSRPALALLAAGALAAGAAFAAPSTDGRILDQYGRSVVPVRFQLRPKERPTGGEGAKERGYMPGIVAGPAGTVIISADVYPDLDAGSDAMEPFEFRLVLADGTEVPAQTAGIDRDLNIAFLHADPERLSSAPPVVFDAGVESSPGDDVLIVTILPEQQGFVRTFQSATVSSVLERPRRMYGIDRPLDQLSIGGLVVKRDGRPLGIVGEELLPERLEGRPVNLLSLVGVMGQGPRPGYPMIFPASVFARSLAAPPALDADSTDRRGWLGIVMQPLSRDLGEYWEIPAPGGVIVGAVVDDSPASRAGLRPGDVIIQVDGQDLPVREAADLPIVQRRIRGAGAGRAVPFAVWREGKVLPFQVELTASPTTVANAEEYENETFGLKVRALTYDFLQGANLDRNTRGVLIVDLDRAGWADTSGLERGDIVQKVAGTAIPDLAGFRAALEKAEKGKPREVVFFVLRGYGTQFVRVKADWRRQ